MNGLGRSEIILSKLDLDNTSERTCVTFDCFPPLLWYLSFLFLFLIYGFINLIDGLWIEDGNGWKIPWSLAY
jgi:hypothetical protein